MYNYNQYNPYSVAYYNQDYLAHYGVKGMKWGVRKAVQRLGRRQANSRAGQLGIKLGKKRLAKQAAKSSKSAVTTSKKPTAKKGKLSTGQKVAIGVGAAVLAAGVYSFASPTYGRGNRTLVKAAAYKAASKVRDKVVARRAQQSMKKFVKSAPRISAKPIIDTTYKNLSSSTALRNTGSSLAKTTTALAKRSSGSNNKLAKAAIIGAAAGAGAANVGYKAYKYNNNKKKNNKSR